MVCTRAHEAHGSITFCYRLNILMVTTHTLSEEQFRYAIRLMTKASLWFWLLFLATRI